MKVTELRPCDHCAKKIAPSFWVIRFSQALIKAQAVNEFMGMHQFFGGRASPALVENGNNILASPKPRPQTLGWGK